MPNALAIVAGGVLGVTVGSYLATLILRLPQGLSTSAGRSRCDSCARPLAAVELIPLISYLAQRGRCRGCGAAISRVHPGIELAAAGVGMASAALLADRPGMALAGAVMGWLLLALAALDWRHFWLPDRLTALLAASGLGVAVLGLGPSPDFGLVPALIGMVAGYASLTGVGLAYRVVRGRDGLGGGDAKLLGAIGAWLGWEALPWVLVLAAGLGLALAAVQVLSGRAIGRVTRLPLGTLMAVAAWPMWLWLRAG